MKNTTALKLENSSKSKSIKKVIRESHTSELIIGFCGPIGTDIHFVVDRFASIIKDDYNYRVEKITLSQLIQQYSTNYDYDSKFDSKFDYYQKSIDSGNSMRSKYDSSILAELAINEIAVDRETRDDDRVCYVIDSIKNKEELELFKLVYNDLFYFIGVFSHLENRINYLEDIGLKRDEIYLLIDRDSGEEIQFGQKVTETFIESDFFIRIDKSSHTSIDPKIKRFLNLVFCNEIITPTKHENAMYLAAAAAGNSACLSRQVGACLTDNEGNVLSVGWNDVPKFGGGVYQYSEDDPIGQNDNRCMNLKGGVCFNDLEKSIIKGDLIKEFIKSGIIKDIDKNKAIELLEKSRIKELIEFSRAVHAEMHAIISAGKKSNEGIQNGTLYCTTYPCHNCARHIITSGINEVYFIEPYRKSLAMKLHRDSITEDISKKDRVRILMFEGVSPKSYIHFFKMNKNKRKDNGKKLIHLSKNISPKKTLSLKAIPVLEGEVTKSLKNKKLIDIENG
ncbi:deoxycytidylate deaminase [Flavobacteriaceae bacterium AU392]|nr:deoxycytidylate deaminase [Flavobacteriaceae bacterium]RKM84935.1 deoxycytidylate deaminase [Flavobacteriaceae bacterium AU392]